MGRVPQVLGRLIERRPLASRSSALARRAAAALARSRITPNQISVASVAVAAAGAGLLLAGGAGALIGAALCIQLRLLCNLLDGMVAIEGGRMTPVGSLYNEIPDRLADSLLVVAAGYAAGFAWLGWCAALLAALTAYVRTLGGALGLAQDFRGPMAKQHRMAVLTLACAAAAGEAALGTPPYALAVALGLIALGSAWTCVARTRAIAAQLTARAATPS